MTLRPVLRRALLGIGAVVLVSVIAYGALFRPWQRRWDGTPAELALLLPGDSIVTDPVHVTTRAITIGAPPELVWPWHVQMGNRRGGLYSYDLLDRWFGVLEAPARTRSSRNSRGSVPATRSRSVQAPGGRSVCSSPAGRC